MCVFFFKQKTAYEMRISDWSSDVCSSDLMHPVALAARELADLLLLVGAAEVEGADIGAALHLALTEVDLRLALADLLPNRLVGRQRIARLVDIAELHRVADAEQIGRASCRERVCQYG